MRLDNMIKGVNKYFDQKLYELKCFLMSSTNYTLSRTGGMFGDIAFYSVSTSSSFLESNFHLSP